MVFVGLFVFGVSPVGVDCWGVLVGGGVGSSVAVGDCVAAGVQAPSRIIDRNNIEQVKTLGTESLWLDLENMISS